MSGTKYDSQITNKLVGLERWKDFVFKREKIYIFPNGYGFLYLGVITIMVLVGATYTNNLIFLLGFFLFSVFVSSMVQTHNNIKDVSVKVTEIEDSYVGGKAKVTIQVQNLSMRTKQSLRVIPRKKVLRPKVPGKVDIIYGKESVRSYFYLNSETRGKKSFRDLTIYTVYPMGLFYSWKYSRVEVDYFVYPEPIDFEIRPSVISLEQYQKREHRPQNQSDHHDDFREHRQHQLGESHHHIDWKVFARTKEKLVKAFESPAGTIRLFDFKQIPRLNSEQRLSQISYWIQQAALRGAVFEVKLGDVKLSAGQGPIHAKACQRELALFREVDHAS